MRSVRIGSGAGFEGDSASALYRQISGGQLDYLAIDKLAELTILMYAGQMRKDPKKYKGYSPSILADMAFVFDEIKSGGRNKDIKVITNAGGHSPKVLLYDLLEAAAARGIDLPSACVEGDNLLERPELLHRLQTNGELDIDKIVSANVYFGPRGTVKALQEGARVVETGRSEDPSLTGAAMIYEFDWRFDDWCRLAAATIAGDINECGAQATGGNFSGWPLVPQEGGIGFPIIQAYSDGTFEVTKHSGIGGMVTRDTVINQLLYELNDPAKHISAGVIANFLSIELLQNGLDRVLVRGVNGGPIIGYPCTDTYKVALGVKTGEYRTSGMVYISNDDIEGSAKQFEEILYSRIGGRPERVEVELNGSILRISIADHRESFVSKFCREFIGVTLSGCEGITYMEEGIPRMHDEVITYQSALIDKRLVDQRVTVVKNGREETFTIPGSEFETPAQSDFHTPRILLPHASYSGRRQIVPLGRIAYGVAGDKGSDNNAAFWTDRPDKYSLLKKKLTADRLAQHLGVDPASIIRYDLDNLLALNFILRGFLRGGATQGLQIDKQGKTTAASIRRDLELEVNESLLR